MRVEKKLAESPALSPTKRTADVLVKLLENAGIDTIFGLPGGPIAPLHDAILDSKKIRAVTVRHESTAMFAAAGYSRITQQPSVVMVTSGPGMLNTINGLASAHCEGLPVVVIAGEVARANFGKRAMQEGTSHHLDIVGMTRHLTKLSMQINEASQAPFVLKMALDAAMSGRKGPVVLTIPVDILRAGIFEPSVLTSASHYAEPDLSSLIEVADVLAKSQRGLIFAGSGTRWGNGPRALLELAERLQMPVATTPKAKGVFPEGHPLSLGVFGYGGHPSTTQYLEGGIDTLFAIGTGFSDPSSDTWSALLRPSEQLIQIDIDARQIGRNYPTTIGLVGAAEFFLHHIIDTLPPARASVSPFKITYHSVASQVVVGDSDLISPQRALWELQQVMPADTIYTVDIGEHLLFALHYLEIEAPDGFVTMMGLASMTSSLGAAMGAKLAAPTRPVVAICGDGGFSMGLADVASVVAERIPIVFFILNDRRYGMVELGNETVFGRTPAYPVTEDISLFASALGVPSFTVSQPNELLRLAPSLRLTDGPIIVDVRIDPSVKMAKNSRFESLARKK